jgi:hypothetical protein
MKLLNYNRPGRFRIAYACGGPISIEVERILAMVQALRTNI